MCDRYLQQFRGTIRTAQGATPAHTSCPDALVRGDDSTTGAQAGAAISHPRI